MGFKSTFSVCSFVLLSLHQTACTQEKKEPSVQISEAPKSIVKVVDPQTENLKKQAAFFRFAASLEREIFKTIRPEFNLPMTQFEILSTILDQRVGIKRNFGQIDCKLYQLEQTGFVFSIYKQCQLPKVLIAEIETKSKNEVQVRFFTKEWARVIGDSVALTAQNRICNLSTEADRLTKLSCQGTALALDQSAEVQELRLTEFVFDQKAQVQVQVVGGFYKNLVEHRKLNLKIPFEGKIKIIEKELKVRDDFAELAKPKQIESEIIQTQHAEGPHGKENDKDDSKENDKENDKENRAEDHKENSEEPQKVNHEDNKEISEKGR